MAEGHAREGRAVVSEGESGGVADVCASPEVEYFSGASVALEEAHDALVRDGAARERDPLETGSAGDSVVVEGAESMESRVTDGAVGQVEASDESAVCGESDCGGVCDVVAARQVDEGHLLAADGERDDGGVGDGAAPGQMQTLESGAVVGDGEHSAVVDASAAR